MKQAFVVLQIVVSVILIILILLQARGTGFGRANGVSGATSFTRRGLEKLVFKSTFVFSFLFIILSILLLIF